MPSFAELEAAGATVGEVRIVAGEIFDLDDARERKRLFAWANALHVRTREEVIARALLFRTGDPVSARLIEENERLLRSMRFLYDAQFKVVAVHDGVADIEVSTRDTWSLDIGVRAGRSGGSNSSGIGLREYNLFGTGTTLSIGHSTDADRSGTEIGFANDHAFGGWTALSVSHATNSDGRSDALSVERPFYALDTRWAAGFSTSRDDRIESIYVAGDVASQYRLRRKRAEVFGGWSPGIDEGWIRRFSVGVGFRDDAYEVAPGRTPPAALNPDERDVAPFLRYELIEDRFERQHNRNAMGRPEFFAMGLVARVQLGWAAKGLGSSREALLYSASVSRGFEPADDRTLLASANLSGEVASGRLQRQRLGASVQYFRPQGERRLFYASAEADVLSRAAPLDTLMLGGDNGLRGYPLRYQSGHRRALFTLEERVYTDVYLWRLFRLGGAAFADLGRAWSGPYANPVNPGWLANVGAGLRIVNTRSAFGNVIHVDLAFPLRVDDDISRVQLLVKARTSF